MTKDKNTLKVFHIIPSDVLGGVEIAAIRAEKEIKKFISYDLFIINPQASGFIEKTLNLSKFLWTILKEPEPILVTSLWPSHIAGCIISIFKRKSHWVPFYHSSVHFSFLDSSLSKLSMRFCTNALADSRKTKDFVRSFSTSMNIQIVPYIFDILNDIDHKKAPGFKSIDFIWIGRDDKNKNLSGFVKFCEYLKNLGEEIAITIISSTDIEPSLLIRISKIKNISVYRDLNWEETQYYLSKSKLLMCTSFKEGFSMVAYEAICHGCLPCGSLVGEVHQIINRSTPRLDDFTDNSFQNFYHEAKTFISNDSKAIEKLKNCAESINAEYPKDYVHSFIQHTKNIIL